MSKLEDCTLGMHRKITRRDFVNGISVSAGGAFLLPQIAAGQEFAPEQAPDYYPPALTGLRGDHAGSFEAAHDLRDTPVAWIFRAWRIPTRITTWSSLVRG